MHCAADNCHPGILRLLLNSCSQVNANAPNHEVRSASRVLDTVYGDSNARCVRQSKNVLCGVTAALGHCSTADMNLCWQAHCCCNATATMTCTTDVQQNCHK